MPKGGKREGAGRPIGSMRPSNLKSRSIRLSDDEYAKVKEYVIHLRKPSE